MAEPHGKYAKVDPGDPEAFAQCDRCGFWYNRSMLVPQMIWSGTHLYQTGTLVCTDRCYDIPNEQLRTIILPPDPPPVINARVPNFAYEEDGPVQTTLTISVLQGAILLPVASVEGFEVGDMVWIQMDNAAFAKEQVSGIDTTNNILSILSPMPFSAPIDGSVTVAATT
jgi:hypothetical protein